MSEVHIAVAIRDAIGCTVASANKATTAAFVAMKTKLRKTGILQIAGFGTFRVARRRRRK